MLALASCALLTSGQAEHFCVRSLVPEPVVLASSCEKNETLRAKGELTLNVSSGESLWVVPSGAAWGCGQPCPSCWEISVAALSAGSGDAAEGFGLGGEAQAEAEAEVAVTEETLQGDDLPEVEELYDSVHEFVRDGSGELKVTSVKLLAPLARNSTERIAQNATAQNATAQSQGCVEVIIEGPATFNAGPTLLRRRRGIGRRGRRRFCRNICRWITFRPGFRRFSCFRRCF